MTCPRNKALLLIKFHNNLCESCKRKFEDNELEIHNLLRNHDYSDHRVLKILCKYKGLRDNKYSCHVLYHANEHNHIKCK